MADSPNNHTFERSKRLTHKRQFERAFAARCTAGDNLLVVYVVPNELTLPRLGVTVGKRHGNAVKRNRLRRLLREAFRLEQHALEGGFDYLLVPKAVPPADLTEYRQRLVRLGRDGVRRWQARDRRERTERRE